MQQVARERDRHLVPERISGVKHTSKLNAIACDRCFTELMDAREKKCVTSSTELSRDYNCDSTTIRLRYDYDEKLAC